MSHEEWAAKPGWDVTHGLHCLLEKETGQSMHENNTKFLTYNEQSWSGVERNRQKAEDKKILHCLSTGFDCLSDTLSAGSVSRTLWLSFMTPFESANYQITSPLVSEPPGRALHTHH